MDVKFGKIRPNSQNLPSEPHAIQTEANIFAVKKESKETRITPKSGAKINDYDSTILENNAYQNIEDDMFKLEHKISLLEDNLSKLNGEIDALESLGYLIQVSDLKERREKIKQELIELNKKYSELGISAKISGQIASVIGFTSKSKKSSISKVQNFIAKKVLSKISKKFNYSQNMKEALENLSNINTSVDELVNLQIPYGKKIERYEKLTAYLNKANVIHAQITKNMNEITKRS